MEPDNNDGTAAAKAGDGIKPAQPAREPPAVGSSSNGNNLRYRRDQDERTRVSPTGTLDASDPQVSLCVCLLPKAHAAFLGAGRYAQILNAQPAGVSAERQCVRPRSKKRRAPPFAEQDRRRAHPPSATAIVQQQPK